MTTNTPALRKKARKYVNHIKYVLNCPWDNFYRGIEAIAIDPDNNINPWIDTRNNENNFIGMIASVISATVAILANTQNLSLAPWEASAAFFIALFLSVMAVITAMHQSIFLNSMKHLPSASERLRHILGISPALTSGKDHYRRRLVRRGTFMYSLPQLTLTYSIFAMFIGLALVTICPLWSSNWQNEWRSPQKVAITAIVGLSLCILSFVSSIAYQYTPR